MTISSLTLPLLRLTDFLSVPTPIIPGLLHCGGRIHNAPMTELGKFPYLLPTKHPFTKLIIYATHEKQLLGGVNSTLTAIRQCYWIPSARHIIRKLLQHCVICWKIQEKPYQTPDTPPLIKERTQNAQPFEFTGVDFTGALYVRGRGDEHKVYVCLFTCAVSRAVHLEIVTDLSAETLKTMHMVSDKPQVSDKLEISEEQTQPVIRPARKTAVRACKKLSEWTEILRAPGGCRELM